MPSSQSPVAGDAPLMATPGRAGAVVNFSITKSDSVPVPWDGSYKRWKVAGFVKKVLPARTRPCGTGLPLDIDTVW